MSKTDQETRLKVMQFAKQLLYKSIEHRQPRVLKYILTDIVTTTSCDNFNLLHIACKQQALGDQGPEVVATILKHDRHAGIN